MSYGRPLLTGAGWAGTLGGVAVCLLLFLSAFLAFESRDDDVDRRPDAVVRLPDIPDERLPTVPLAQPPASSAGEGGAGGGSGAGGVRSDRGEGGRRGGPETRTPRTGAGRPGPGGGAGAPPASGGGGGGSQPPPSGGGGNTLGETTRRVTRDAGRLVGNVSSAGGQLITGTGESAADAVEQLPPVPLPDLPEDAKPSSPALP